MKDDNALKVLGFTLPNPIVMAENMLSDGAIFKNENDRTDNFGKVKFKGATLKQDWAFLGGEGFMGKSVDQRDAQLEAAILKTARQNSTGVAGVAQASSGVDHSTRGGGHVTVQQGPRKSAVAGQHGAVQQGPGKVVMQSPVQSPIQSPIQGPPQKMVVQAKEPDQIHRGLKNPLAVPIGIADGTIDFLTHCVSAHVEFLWKDPLSILRDPVAAIGLNRLEINPLGHIFKSIEEANQRDKPMQQLLELPMGVESMPIIKNTKAGQISSEKMAAMHDHRHVDQHKK